MTVKGSPATPLPPRRSRPLLWMGCGALPVLLIGIVVLAVFAFVRFARSRYAGTTASGAGTVTAEVRHLRWLDEHSGDPLAPPTDVKRCFFGALVNTGTVPMRKAYLHLTFHDAQDVRVGVQRWSSQLAILSPGEAEPIFMCALPGTYGPKYTQSLEVHPAEPRGRYLPLEVTGLATSEYGPTHYEAQGVVHNNSGVAVKRVQIVISLFNAANEIVGGQVAAPAGGMDLGAGERARFNQTLRGAIENARIEVRAIGYTDR